MRVAQRMAAVMLLLSAMFSAEGVWAWEKSLQVDLSRRIAARVVKVGSIQAEADKALEVIVPRQKKVVHEVQTTDDPEERQALKHEYLELRKGWLEVNEARVAAMEEQFAGMAFDMEALKAIDHQSSDQGSDAGLPGDNPAVRQRAGAIFHGFAAVIRMVEAADPDVDLSLPKETLNNLDQRVRRAFSTSVVEDLDHQLEFVKTCMILAQSLKRLFSSEVEYLQPQILFNGFDLFQTGIPMDDVLGGAGEFSAADEVVFGQSQRSHRPRRIDPGAWQIN